MPVRAEMASQLDGRIERLRAVLARSDLDWAFLTSPQTIFYLTGFGSTGYYLPHILAVPKDGPPRFILRDFEVPALRAVKPTIAVSDWGCRTTFDQALGSFLQDIGSGARRRRIGVEGGSNFMPYKVLRSIKAVSGIELVDIGTDVEALRRAKDDSELVLLRKAGAIAAEAMSDGIRKLAPGMSEKQMAMMLLNRMIECGGDFPASYPYVFFGERTRISMQQPTDRMLSRADAIYLECGARAGAYSAALIRTGAWQPTPQACAMYAHARAMFEIMFGALRAGVRASDVDAQARAYVRTHGLEAYWLHRGGYSMGVSFAPGWGEGGVIDIRPDNDAIVPAGCVFHLVSLLCLPDLGFVGLSETVEVSDREAVSLTPYPREILDFSAS